MTNMTAGQNDEERAREAHEVPDQPIGSRHRDSRAANRTTPRRRCHQVALSFIATGNAVAGFRYRQLYAPSICIPCAETMHLRQSVQVISGVAARTVASRLQRPDRPPSFDSNRISSMVIPRSTAFNMS